MKNIPFFLLIIGLIAFGLGCDKCKDKCASVDAVLPDNNPAGYEVLLKVTGLSDSAKVVFGTVEAISRPGAQSGEIIATVPDGLSGNVEISVEEGDCIARFEDFVVTGTLPGEVQPSLQQIIIPTPPSPGSIPTEGISANWINAADPTTFTFGIHFNGTFLGGLTETPLEGSFEFNYQNPAFNDNPVTGTANTATNVIYIEVNRTANGGSVEHFDGQFIQVPSFLPIPASFAMLLTSRETGRQLLLYYPG